MISAKDVTNMMGIITKVATNEIRIHFEYDDVIKSVTVNANQFATNPTYVELEYPYHYKRLQMMLDGKIAVSNEWLLGDLGIQGILGPNNDRVIETRVQYLFTTLATFKASLLRDDDALFTKPVTIVLIEPPSSGGQWSSIVIYYPVSIF